MEEEEEEDPEEEDEEAEVEAEDEESAAVVELDPPNIPPRTGWEMAMRPRERKARWRISG